MRDPTTRNRTDRIEVVKREPYRDAQWGALQDVVAACAHKTLARMGE
jgi:hypothetical protein